MIIEPMTLHSTTPLYHSLVAQTAINVDLKSGLLSNRACASSHQQETLISYKTILLSRLQGRPSPLKLHQ